MAVSLGKRKRSQPKELNLTEESPNIDSAQDQESLQEIFRKHFEARFKPLPVAERKPDLENISSDESEQEEYGDEWGGFSGDEKPAVAIIEHIETTRHTEESMDKRELRAFLSSKVPIQKTAERPGKPLVLKPKGDDDEDSATNLKNDLALQRLLSESHLLSKEDSGGMNPTGKLRHKALDLRFQALGSKDSVFAQQKMPMNIRKGMVKKKGEREQKRRKDAKEGGVILEKEVRTKKTIRKRDRGVDAPAVGNFKRGLLTLSGKDLRDIQSTRSHGPRKHR